MNRRPGHVVVTTEVAVCSFCGRPRTLRTEQHQLGALVRTIVTCETCHRTLSGSIGVASLEPDALEPVALSPERPSAPPANLPPPRAAPQNPAPKPAAASNGTGCRPNGDASNARAPNKTGLPPR